jgi:hypothetical protein
VLHVAVLHVAPELPVDDDGGRGAIHGAVDHHLIEAPQEIDAQT